MTNFSYDDTIPATNNNPSADQPKMLINTQSTKAILAVDHVTFGANDGGTHKQINFTGKNVPVGFPALDHSILYTGSGTVLTDSQLFFKNENIILPTSAVKAFGSFTVAALSTTFINSYNTALSINGSGQISTVTLTTGATSGTTFVVIPFITGNQPLSYAITGPNTFTLTTGAAGVGQIISFIVLQV